MPENSSGTSKIRRDNRRKRISHVDSFGISFRVFHSSEPFGVVRSRTPIATHQLDFDLDDEIVTLKLPAYKGGRGNDVELTLPMHGLRTLLHSLELQLAQEELRQEALLMYPLDHDENVEDAF